MLRAALSGLPNVLSLSRLALAPLFVVLRWPEARLALVALAALTDVLDGWLARRQRITSRAGAILDPVADRLFVLTALAVFVAEGELSLAQVLLLLTRDIATTIGFFVARVTPWLRRVELRARIAGKAVTALQVAALVAVLLLPAAVNALVVVTALMSVVAIADYTRMLWAERET
jgi:cardiolipin synthase (CMP-forming)